MLQEQPATRRCVSLRALFVLFACAGAACSEDNAGASKSADQPDGATAPSNSAEPSPSAAGPAALDAGVGGEPITSATGVDASVPRVDAAAPVADASVARVDASAASVDASAASVDAASIASSGLPDVYVCQAMLAAQPPDPSGQGAEGASCCGGRGSCQRRSSIALELKASLGHDSCKGGTADDDLACAPTMALTPKACHGQTGAASLEGRCLPRCFLLGTPAALLLASSDCAADEACGTCYDPVTGKATGACALQPTEPAKEPAPAPFKPCGVYKNSASAGVCMPKVLAQASKNPVVDLLPRDVCSDAEVCMPNLKAANYGACFAPCDTSALVQAAGSKEGGCIPPYIAASTNPEAIIFLERGKCAAGELCAPCLDPTKDFAVSGACN